MRNSKYLFCLLTVVLSMHTAVFSQAYKAGDKVEALVGNTWKEVTIIKPVAGKAGVFEVKITASKANRSTAGNNIAINKSNMRVPKVTAVVARAAGSVVAAEPFNLHPGRYELYSGIPTMYLGHFILLSGGKYKLAFNTDEDNYEIGTYAFHAGTGTIEWLTGMFKNNNWGGKLVNRPGNGFRIEFNKATFAESN